MATTTNFGWETPDDTDLVKDGAAAMRTLGNSIDTSFVDLKGGTTGQVLSKASNTDLDFTWVTDAAGDITAVTAGTGITGGGTSGAVTVSFDQANFGGGQYAAAKNKILNSDFAIWQRGTSINLSSATAAYTADRFKNAVTFSAGTCTVSKQTFTAGAAPVAGYEGAYFHRTTLPASGSITYYETTQFIEDVQTFAGQTVILSFWAKASASLTLTSLFSQNFGSGGSAGVDTGGSTHSLTTSWQRFTVSVSLPSISGKTVGTSSFLAMYLYTTSGLSTSMTIDIWGVQLEAGSTATPFQTATGTKQGELAACQRYYFDSRENGTTNQPFNGYSNSTDYLLSNVRYPVTMRTTPSITIGQSSGTNYVRRISTNAQVAITVTSYPGTAPTGFSAVYASAAPFVAAVGYDFYILASAEL